MPIQFWIWLGVIVLTAIIEICTMELVSVWFTIGAIPAFILSAIPGVSDLWEVQVAVFVVVSALLIIFLRRIAKKVLLRNADEKTNIDALVGKKLRMLERTDFETIGSVKVNDVVWSALGEDQQTIEKDEIVRVIKVDGNKLIVRKEDKDAQEAKENKEAKQDKAVKKDKKSSTEKEGGKE